ncbi:MAG: hypothetical protein Kow00120_09760 [Anaerolineae bacterium]
MSESNGTRTGFLDENPWRTFLIVAAIFGVIWGVFGVAGFWGEGLVIVALAAYFPLTYLAYHNFRRPVQIERLAEDFQLLGLAGRPTTKGAEKRAKALAEERYGASFAPLNYLLHISLAVLLVVVGMMLFFWPPATGDMLNANALQAMRYGFLGAYLFAAQLVYRRYTTYDLQPTVYLQGALTLIAGLAFNYVAFEAAGYLGAAPQSEPATGLGAGALAVIAFSLGYFPSLAIRWFNRVAYGAVGIDQRRADALPLGLIDGISQWHEARLQDNGIDNVQNLASADILDLLVNTTFSGQQVIDWIDQSILYLYLEAAMIERFRDAGVRTTSDFRDLWNSADPDMKQNFAQQLQSNVAQLDLLHRLTAVGPNLHYVLNYWANAGRLARHRQETYLAQMLSDWRGVLEAAGATPVADTARLERLAAQAEALHEEIVEETGREPALPETPLTLVGQGNLAYHAGELDRAMSFYQRALALDPDAAPAHAALATVYLRTGQTALAGTHFEKAAASEADPRTLALILNDRAIYYRRTGELDKALEDLNRAISLRPDLAHAHVTLGDVYRDKGEYQQAVESYRNAIALDPTLAVAYNNLAWLFIDKLQENLGEAMHLAQRAVELSKVNGYADPAYLDTLAAAQIKLGKLEDARANLLEAQSARFVEAPVRESIDAHLEEIAKLESGG